MQPVSGRPSGGSRSGPAGPAMLRAAALTVLPAVVRSLTSPQAQRRARSLLRAVRPDRLERIPLLLAEAGGRHPLAPAAVRVERTRGVSAEQTAVTVWFREGPALPLLDMGGPPGRRGAAVRIGAGLLGAAALAAATTAAARLQDNPRLRVVDAAAADSIS